MKSLHKLKIIFSLFLSLISKISFGQILESSFDAKYENESFENLLEGIIKKEISYFIISGGKWEYRDSLIKTKLIELPIKMFTDSSALFSLGKITVEIKGKQFDTLGHKLTYANPNQPFLALIDDRQIWGADGGVPKKSISSITYLNTNIKNTIPDSALINVFEPNFCYTSENKTKCHCGVYQSLDKKRLYIYMLNSDGAGGYEVTWVIENNKYSTRIIDYGF